MSRLPSLDGVSINVKDLCCDEMWKRTSVSRSRTLFRASAWLFSSPKMESMLTRSNPEVTISRAAYWFVTPAMPLRVVPLYGPHCLARSRSKFARVVNSLTHSTHEYRELLEIAIKDTMLIRDA